MALGTSTSSDASHALAVREKVNTLLNAAKDGNLDLLKKTAQVLDEGDGIAETIIAVKDANGRGVLHFAAREGRTNVCKYLIEDLKLDVDMKDDDGETPLIHAARQGHFECSQYLLDHGANPLEVSKELGVSALHHAAAAGNKELLKLLLAKGAFVDSPSDAGTPLIWAAGHDRSEAVKVLLEHGANPNAETDDNITALLSAVAAGSYESVELLVKAGAKVSINAGGTTPLHIAADSGNEKIISCLLNAGADANARDEENFTPIKIAATKGNRAIVEMLYSFSSKDPEISEWSIDNILSYGQRIISNDKEVAEKVAEKLKDTKIDQLESIKVSPENKRKALEAKFRGDKAFRNKDYSSAVECYTEAIDLDPSDAVLFSNRSVCYIRLGQLEQALADAKICKQLRPDWPKSYYREGAALRLLQRFDEAANSFYEGVTLDPENMELVDAFREAVEEGRKHHGVK